MPPTALRTIPVKVPGSTNTISFRPLSILELQAARKTKEDEQQAQAFALIAAVGDFKAAIDEAGEDAIADARRAARDEKANDPTNPENYDAATLFRCGIVSWDYTYEDGSPYECDSTTKVTLDPVDGEWALEQILKLSARSPGEGSSSAKLSAPTRSQRS